MTMLKDRRDRLATMMTGVEDLQESLMTSAAALDLIDELIEQLEHPARVPVLFISVEGVQRMFDEEAYLIHQTVTPALVEDLAAALAETYLPYTLYEALDEILYDRYANDSYVDEDED